VFRVPLVTERQYSFYKLSNAKVLRDYCVHRIHWRGMSHRERTLQRQAHDSCCGILGSQRLDERQAGRCPYAVITHHAVRNRPTKFIECIDGVGRNLRTKEPSKCQPQSTCRTQMFDNDETPTETLRCRFIC